MLSPSMKRSLQWMNTTILKEKTPTLLRKNTQKLPSKTMVSMKKMRCKKKVNTLTLKLPLSLLMTPSPSSKTTTPMSPKTLPTKSTTTQLTTTSLMIHIRPMIKPLIASTIHQMTTITPPLNKTKLLMTTSTLRKRPSLKTIIMCLSLLKSTTVMKTKKKSINIMSLNTPKTTTQRKTIRTPLIMTLTKSTITQPTTTITTLITKMSLRKPFSISRKRSRKKIISAITTSLITMKLLGLMRLTSTTTITTQSRPTSQISTIPHSTTSKSKIIKTSTKLRNRNILTFLKSSSRRSQKRSMKRSRRKLYMKNITTMMRKRPITLILISSTRLNQRQHSISPMSMSSGKTTLPITTLKRHTTKITTKNFMKVPMKMLTSRKKLRRR